MAANPPIGNNFIEGVLGVCRVSFNGVDYGKTLNNIEIQKDQDIKEIFYAQDGTKRADNVRTGIAYMVTCEFAVPTIALLNAIDAGISKSGAGNSASFGRNNYTLWSSESSELVLTRVDSEGDSSVDPFFKMTFYKAHGEQTGPIAYGPDQQRTIQVTFHIYYDETKNSFGYVGYETSLGL